MPKIDRILAADAEGNKFWMTQAQCNALELLEDAHAGGCASIKGYVPETGYIERPTIDVQFISRFNYTRLLERRKAALEAITFEDVQPHLTDAKFASKSEDDLREIFADRKAMELASIQKTLDGDRSDAYRQGHDRCYKKIADGVDVHLVTAKGEDGLMHPVLTDGYPTVKSIMLSHLELNRKVIKEGVKKVVNSGVPFLMGNAIKKVLNDRSVGFRRFSLKEDNFESLSISHSTIIPDDLVDLVD